MYLYLGQETVVKSDEIIGIFDMDNTTQSKITRDYLSAAEKSGDVINVTWELPKSFVVCSKKGKKENRVYVSQLASSTLEKRSNVKLFR